MTVTVRFTDYFQATAHARRLATHTNQDVAVRRVPEFGKDGFNVSFAAWNDSDYALAEIIHPGEPLSQRELDAEKAERGIGGYRHG